MGSDALPNPHYSELHKKQGFLENLPNVASQKMGFTGPFLNYKHVKPWKVLECA